MDFEEATPLLSGAKKPLQNVELSKDESDAMDEKQLMNICTQQHAVDYDGDGDLDLVVGCFGTSFFLYENERDAMKNSLVEKPVELTIKAPGHHGAPHLADFDGDGDLDLLSGSVGGGVYLAKNEGTRTEPKYEKFETLIGPGSHDGTLKGEEPAMAVGTRVWAADVNGDGLMDLLVGDQSTIITPAKGVSSEEYLQMKAKEKKQMARLFLRQQELTEEEKTLGPEVQEKLNDIMSEMYNSGQKNGKSEMTGFVWLILQKPVAADKDVSLK